MARTKKNWTVYDYADADELDVIEYDITSAPNDFNVLTIFNFIESKAVHIPGFQRNYVWDRGRASKLIESLILGLPVPQIFLYETNRNQFLVIDGQQRLMSIYFFIKQRFPKKEKRSELRSIFEEAGKVPDDILENDKYFENFRLKLPDTKPAHRNQFNGSSYTTLSTYKTQFDMRTIRNVIIKQNSPKADDSAMYEIFNRLNTGGVNLRPQEIRASMYHSHFYETLNHINQKPSWRELLANQEPDLHMKDIEILLRGLAMLVDGKNYSPSMTKFLNQFSRKCRENTEDYNKFLSDLLDSFLLACTNLPKETFLNKKNQFNLALYEAVFTATCKNALKERRMLEGSINKELIQQLKTDELFLEALKDSTTQTKNVKKRIERATEILGSL